jgi:hypothetical protein
MQTIQPTDQLVEHRRMVLNREFVRMQDLGWEVEFLGDHLRCTMHHEGTAPITKFLFSVALGVAAALVVVEVVAAADLAVELPSKNLMIGAGAALGMLSWYLSFRKVDASARVVTVTLDAHGRPVVLPA